jgi:hypothetical protein
VFQFVSTWTDFLNPVIYLHDSDKYTLSIGIYPFFGQHDVEWGKSAAHRQEPEPTHLLCTKSGQASVHACS